MNSTVVADVDSPYGYFSWELPSAVDNTGDIEVVCSHLPGAAFEIGYNHVECNATDAAGLDTGIN